MRKYIAKVIGTFTMVFCGTGAVVFNQETQGVISHPGIAIIFGLIVMATIYTFGNISGAHLNPTVTIAFTLAGRFKRHQVLPNIIAQVTGASLARGMLRLLFPANKTLGTTVPAVTARQSFVLKLLLTFFLMLVIIKVATGSKEQSFAGPICGATTNPAFSIGPALVSGHLEHFWLYIVAPIAGAALAMPGWLFVNPQTDQHANSTL